MQVIATNTRCHSATGLQSDADIIDWLAISARLNFMLVFVEPFDIVGPEEIDSLRHQAMLDGPSVDWEIPMNFVHGAEFVALDDEVYAELADIRTNLDQLVPLVREAVRLRTAYAGFLDDWVHLNRVVERYHAYEAHRPTHNSKLLASVRSAVQQTTKQQELWYAGWTKANAKTLTQNGRKCSDEKLLDLIWQIHLRQSMPPAGFSVPWFERMLTRRKKGSTRICDCKLVREVCAGCSPFKRSLSSLYYRSNRPIIEAHLRLIESTGIMLPPLRSSAYENYHPTLKG